MRVEKIILEADSETTSDERDLMMLNKIEEMLGTGPIIGEGREVILNLSRNLMIRDLILTSLGVPEDAKEELFRKANEIMREKDAKILKERKKCK